SHQALLELPDPAAFTVTRITVDFQRAARIDDALVVRTTYDAVKGPRLMIAQRIFRGGDLIATAAVEAACIGLDGRARRPPPGLVEALRPLFG
ncbi:acyl-CoA thioesterase, partial [Phenylobacterium sp.]|uniref:acyl-CoA thioesterase n=1 Tax=Phenylobacterium sp. TaxID=1871053 RepID=UPI002DEBAD86|nr:hotdog domain-containing protein [Phenylobacterium sp.]